MHSLLDPESQLFLYHVEIEQRLRQQAGLSSVSDQRSSLIQRVRQYWQQVRGRSASERVCCRECCPA